MVAVSEASEDKKDDLRRSRLLDALAKGATLEEASALAGVASRTVRRWRQADPELADAVMHAMYDQDDAVEAITYKNCIDPDPAHNTLRMFWLKCRRPEIYRDQVQHAHTGTINLVWTDDENRGDSES